MLPNVVAIRQKCLGYPLPFFAPGKRGQSSPNSGNKRLLARPPNHAKFCCATRSMHHIRCGKFELL